MSKPHPDFPLYQHRSGQWAKRIGGKLKYFGSWRLDPDGTAAMLDFEHRLPWLLKGTEPPNREDGKTTVRHVLNVYLTRKKGRLASGEIAERTYKRYKATAETVRDFFGATTPSRSLVDDDFERLRKHLAERYGPVALHNEIGMIRSIFGLAQRKGLVSRRIDFDECFEKPPAKLLRMNRDKKKAGQQFQPAEIRVLLAAAPVNVKAMILLGIQAGFGNTDVALLPLNCLAAETGWLNYARTKTGIMRRIPLWPETAAAIQAVIAARREPKRKADAGLLFIGGRGCSLVGDRRGSEVGDAFDVVMKSCGLSGRTFYDLRRNFKTIAKRCKNADAVKAIMGHASPENDMSARYDLQIEDAELRRAVDVVREWLFPSDGQAASPR